MGECRLESAHFEAVCKTKVWKEVMAVTPAEKDNDDMFFLRTVIDLMTDG